MLNAWNWSRYEDRNMNGRHELKYYINPSDYAQLRSRLCIVAKPDKNADEGGGYRIRSLYFDNYQDKMVTEKLSGLNNREKFRIRYYNENIDFMNLEKKSKRNGLTYKEKAALTKEECDDILSGRYQCLKEKDVPLLAELYAKMHYQGLRPRVIVEYDREVYVYPAGNVRVTIDSGIRMSNHVFEFLNPDFASIPAANALIMEVKYDGFIPDVMRQVLQIDQRNRTEFSKYIVSRLV